MAKSESKVPEDSGKHRPQVQSAGAAGTPPTASEAKRSDTAAGSRSGPTELPAQFGRYRVKKKLGGGGMGSVYLVENADLEREEALKVPHFSDGDDPQLRERFLREAKSAAKLDHANLCPVYDAGVQDGIYYMTMRFLKGKLLSDYTGTAQPSRKAVEIVTKLAQALDAAHSKGVIHRDLKPSNVMMVGGVGPVVMDFGLAKQVKQPDQKLTQAGSMLGTPAYMPPEQVNGELEKMGPASDVYSLGVILYELLTGRLPFEGSMAAIFGQILYTDPPLPSAVVPGLNPALDGICRKAMAKASTERFPSMKAFTAALMGYLRSMPATDGAGNLVPTAPDKAAILQAPTVAPGPLPAGKSDFIKNPRVAPGPVASAVPLQARKSLVSAEGEAKAPSAIRKPEGSPQKIPVAKIADDEGEMKDGASFGAILVRMILLMLVFGGLGAVGWVTYIVIQKMDQPHPDLVDDAPATKPREGDSKTVVTKPQEIKTGKTEMRGTKAEKANSDNTETGKAKTGKPDTEKTQTGKADKGKTDTDKAAPGIAETGKAEFEKADTGKVETGKADIGKTNPEKPDTGKTETGKMDTGKAETGKADIGKADAGKADTGKAETGKTKVADDSKVLFKEDFSSFELGGLPKDWQGAAFSMLKLNGEDDPCLKVTVPKGLKFVTLPKREIKGDFELECELRLGSDKAPSGKKADLVLKKGHEFELKLESMAGTLTVKMNALGTVKLEEAQDTTQQGFKAYEKIYFRLTRKGTVYKVFINGKPTAVTTILGHGTFEKVSLGLTGGGINGGELGNLVARIYSVKIISGDMPTGPLDVQIANAAAAKIAGAQGKKGSAAPGAAFQLAFQWNVTMGELDPKALYVFAIDLKIGNKVQPRQPLLGPMLGSKLKSAERYITPPLPYSGETSFELLLMEQVQEQEWHPVSNVAKGKIQ